MQSEAAPIAETLEQASVMCNTTKKLDTKNHSVGRLQLTQRPTEPNFVKLLFLNKLTQGAFSLWTVATKRFEFVLRQVSWPGDGQKQVY